MTEWMGLPPLATAHGGQIDSLIGWMHVFMLILFVGWGGFFVYTAWSVSDDRGIRWRTTPGSSRTRRPIPKSAWP